MSPDLTTMDVKLINRVQKHFPICNDPFSVIATDLDLDKAWVIQRLITLQSEGIISRFGSVAKRKNENFSTLAALKVPLDRVNDIAHLVSSYQEITHNYLREHEYNLWFVVQSKSETKLQNTLDDLRQHMDFPMLNLPILESYHNDSVITL